MPKKPFQLRIDQAILERVEVENKSQLIRQLLTIYLGLPVRPERGLNDISGETVDLLETQIYLLEKKRLQGECSLSDIKVVERLHREALSVVHPNCFGSRSLDLLRGQLLVGRLALLKFDLEWSEPELRAREASR